MVTTCVQVLTSTATEVNGARQSPITTTATTLFQQDDQNPLLLTAPLYVTVI